MLLLLSGGSGYRASSSNTAVATCSVSGTTLTVTPVGAGTCTITVYDSANNTTTVSVTVGAAMSVSPTSITFNDPASSAQTVTISNGASPYTGSSSNTSIATVSVSGTTATITPVATGTCTITITDHDGETSIVSVTVNAKVSVSPTTVTFTDPKSAAQNVTISNGSTPYTGSSSNTGIATVSVSGSTATITPVATGSATITITDHDGETATVSVTVGAAVSVSPSSVTFTDPKSASQTATVSGGRSAYTVSSSNTSIATTSISGSTVTINPVAAGSATITVTDADSETCTISVTVGAAVSVSPTTLTLSVGGGNGTATVSGGRASYTVSSSNSSAATATISGTTVTVTPVGAGSATITVKDADNETATIAVTVTSVSGPSASPSTVNFSDPKSANQTSTISGGTTPYNTTVTTTNSAVATATLSGTTITISAHGTGSAVLTVKDANNNTCTISVSVGVALSVSPTALALSTTGNNGVSTASGGATPYTASSNNNSIATASVSGTTITVVPISVGSAVITVTDADGETATINVSVTAPATLSLQTLLDSRIKAPCLYIWAELPVIVNQYGNIDAAKLGSQIILDKVTKFSITNVLNIGADKMDFQLDDLTNQYSPLNNQSKFGRYFAPGAVDIKYQAWLGLSKDGVQYVYPKGVYVSESVNQESYEGSSTLTVNALDQFNLFQGDAYASFPPRLYGDQTSGYFNPNYALTNPSGDLKTYVCDAMYWMSATNQLPIWSSDYVNVAVYSSAVSSGGVPVPNSGSTAYTINYNTGTITFSTAQGASDVISVDARPLAMRPEVALYHLFVDYGNWDPAFIKFDNTGTVIPLIELARDRPILDIAKDLVALIGPKGQRWNLWMDGNGYLRLSEQAQDGPAVKTLLDTQDIIKASPEYSTKDLYNVVRAKSYISSNQPVEVISYDIYSISTYSQMPTFDVPSQLVNMTKTMDAGSGMSYLNNICNSLLFEYCRPSVKMEIQISPDPSLNPGDPINIIETKTGIGANGVPSRFRITQIENQIDGDQWSQILQVERQNLSQDWNFGISANLGTADTTNANAIVTQSGYLIDVSLNNSTGSVVHVVQNGQPLTDAAFQPYIFNWDGSALTISVTFGNLQSGATAYIWRWMYIAQDAYYNNQVITGNGSVLPSGNNWTGITGNLIASLIGNAADTLPYDVRANVDSPISRKFWWPLLRCSEWLTDDGVTGYTSQTTLSSTWSGGPGVSGNWTCYGNLVVGKNDFFGDVTSGFVGQQLFANGTPAANAIGTGSTIKYGVDFGNTITASPVHQGIKDKYTPVYLCILVASTSGTMQFKKIPLMLTL